MNERKEAGKNQQPQLELHRRMYEVYLFEDDFKDSDSVISLIPKRAKKPPLKMDPFIAANIPFELLNRF